MLNTLCIFPAYKVKLYNCIANLFSMIYMTECFYVVHTTPYNIYIYASIS